MFHTTPPEHPLPRKPPPSVGLVVNAMFVVACAGALALKGVLELVAPTTPFALCGAACLTPAATALGVAQLVAVLRRSPVAARLTANMAAGAFAVLAFGFLANAAESWSRRRPFDADVILVLTLLALSAGYAFFVARLNRAWAAELGRPLPAGLCIFCGYDLRGSPGRCPECGRAA